MDYGNSDGELLGPGRGSELIGVRLNKDNRIDFKQASLDDTGEDAAGWWV